MPTSPQTPKSPEAHDSQQPQLYLIDSHAHLEYPQFDEDRDDMLDRARDAGVRTILAIGGAAGPDHLASAIPYAEAHDWIYASSGIHPHEAPLANDSHFAKLAEIFEHPRIIACGEIGLDYHYPNTDRNAQQKVFRRQMAMAASAQLPVVIHCRDAWSDCLEMLQSDWQPPQAGGIFHCFSGLLDEAKKGIELGFYISFAANITYTKSQNLRDIAAALPLDRMLIETDSPYLPPQDKRGKRNEPAYVAEVARTIASVRDLDPTVVASQTAANFKNLFKLDQN